MNREKLNLDPVSRGFFSDESLEIAERVGLALIESAKYTDIEFDKNGLPFFDTCKNVGGRFSYFSSVWYDFGSYERFAEEHPEDAEALAKYRDKAELFNMESANLVSTVGKVLSDTGSMWGGSFGGHSNPDFGRVINLGTDGIREIIRKYKEINTCDTDWFYRACEYAMDAIDILGDRYRELAEKLAESADSDDERAYYQKAAKAFETVPRRPAPDFTAAAHVFWMLFTFDGIDSPGRFDQYMYRAWEATVDKAEARDMLSRIWEGFHDTRAWNLCVSGSDETWRDVTNSLSYEILRLAADKKYETPNLTVRVHRNTPDKLWEEITNTLASGIGMPVIYNDEVVCPALESMNIPPCDSHCYCMNGCNQIDIMGKSHMGLEDGEVMFTKAMEYTLWNGVNTMKGNVMSTIPTGDTREFKSYEEFERAFLRQLQYLTNIACNHANSAQQIRAVYGANPFRSCLIEGCLEKGLDYRNGGPLYGNGQILAEGIADAGDSLWAVKKLVYDEKKYTMAELLEALAKDFAGFDELYRDFSSCEKFGNDISEVDEITSRILNRFFTILRRQRTYRGGFFSGGCSPDDRATYYGAQCAALPNGKRRAYPLIADSIAAVPGCDVKGPTSLVNSVLKYDHRNAGSGFIFQIKFDKKNFCTEKGKESFIGLAKTYFAGGGQQITATVVSPEELLDAVENPDRHRNLIVRVGGFSGYFVELADEIQQSVIKRTFVGI